MIDILIRYLKMWILSRLSILDKNTCHLIPKKQFTKKHLCQSLFFNKVAGLRPATFLKTRLWHRWFPLNFAKFLRTSVVFYAKWKILSIKTYSSLSYFSHSSLLIFVASDYGNTNICNGQHSNFLIWHDLKVLIKVSD